MSISATGIENPEILRKMSQALRARQQGAAARTAKAGIAERRAALAAQKQGRHAAVHDALPQAVEAAGRAP